jgi:hypothetical protein
MNEDNEIEDIAPWVVIALTLVGFVVRVLLLANKGLWTDEALSLWIANHNIGEMLQWISRIDFHPPLYYLLLHYWIDLVGANTYNLRLLSAIIGAATIPVIYLIGRRMSGLAMGLAAAILLAFSPFNIRFAQETRMYTLLMFNASVAIYALVRLLSDPGATRPFGSQFRGFIHAWRVPSSVEPDPQKDFSYDEEIRNSGGWRGWIARHRWPPISTIETDLAWVVFIVFSAGTMLSHNAGVLFPLATNAFVLSLMIYQRMKKPGVASDLQAPSLLNWVIAQLGILLLWSPWAYSFIRQAGRVLQGYWISRPSLNGIIQSITAFISETIPGQPARVAVMWIISIIFFVMGMAHFRKQIWRFMFLAALFAIPFVAELIVSIRQPVFLDRTLIWTTIPFFLILGAGVAQIKIRPLIFVVMGVIITINLFAAGDYFRFVQKEDWSTPAGFVANFAQKNDLVLFNSPETQIPFDYYFKDYEEMYGIQVEKHGVPADLFDSGTLEPVMTERDVPGLISLLEGRRAVWLVYGSNSNTDPTGLIPKTVASMMNLVHTREFNGGQVQIYTAP